VTAHELAAAPERGAQARPLHHDDGDDDRPPGEQQQAGDDEQHEAEEDAEDREDAGEDERAQHGSGRPEELAQGEVPPSVLDVADRLDDHALEPEAADERGGEGEDPEARAVVGADERLERGQRHEDDERRGDDEARLRAEGGDRALDDLADVHGAVHVRRAAYPGAQRSR
jgi:hypothetical protein